MTEGGEILKRLIIKQIVKRLALKKGKYGGVLPTNSGVPLSIFTLSFYFSIILRVFSTSNVLSKNRF
jgi:hypothetical protein